MKLMRVIRAGVIGAALVAAAACSTVSTPSSGAFSSTDLHVGTGAVAATGNTITVNYTVWLYDSTKPDGKGLIAETTLGRDPQQYVLGNGTVIAGWEQGIPGMKVGGLRRLVIPPSLAYGAERNGSVPPNSTLVFEIELVDVK